MTPSARARERSERVRRLEGARRQARGEATPKATGELVERSTYQAYGGTESDYRPERWKSFREDYRFTGKEEDVEVGLIYFGKRFLNPLLNRWVSADPLAIHGLGADPNLYAYVSGRVLQNTDPFGLEGVGPRAATDPTYDDAVRVAKGAWNFFVELASARASMDLSEQRAARNAAYFNGDPSKSDARVLKDVQENGLGRYKFEGKTPEEQKDLEGMETAISVVTLVPALVSGGVGAVGAIRRGVSKAKRAVQIARGLAKLEKEADAVVDTLAGAGSRGSAGLKVKSQAPSGGCAGGQCAGGGVCFVAGTIVWTDRGPRAIETLALGERVWDQGASCETPDLTGEWRTVSLSMPNPDGSGDILKVELLRPLSWLESQAVRVGARLQLSLSELGVSGPAQVTAVEPAPAIEPGTGCVVMATVQHLSDEVLRIRFDETAELMGVTGAHRLFSAARGWIPARELEPGERLKTADGMVTIAEVQRVSSEPVRVYNVEIGVKHQYYVLGAKVLAHNTTPGGVCGNNAAGGSAGGPRAGKPFTKKGKAEIGCGSRSDGSLIAQL